MKLRSIIIAAAITLTSAFYVNAQTKQENPKQQSEQVLESKKDTLTFTVYGMDCPGCEGSLEKQIGKIEAVKDAKANWLNQELKIVLFPDSNITVDQLDKRVKKANFTLDKKALKDEE